MIWAILDQFYLSYLNFVLSIFTAPNTCMFFTGNDLFIFRNLRYVFFGEFMFFRSDQHFLTIKSDSFIIV